MNDREFVIRTIDDITTSNVIQLAFIRIMPAHFWVDEDPTVGPLEPSLDSGPYSIAPLEQGRYVTIERVPDYWGRDIPVNRGRYNFDEPLWRGDFQSRIDNRRLLKVSHIDRLTGARRFQDAKDDFHRFDVVPTGA